MAFIVVELQTTGGTTTVLTTTHDTYAAAQSKYHTVLAYAAVSEVGKHAAALMREDGFVLAHEVFDHEDQDGEEA